MAVFIRYSVETVATIDSDAGFSGVPSVSHRKIQKVKPPPPSTKFKDKYVLYKVKPSLAQTFSPLITPPLTLDVKCVQNVYENS